MMCPLGGGDAWSGDTAASANAVEDYSAPTRVTAVISATARRPAADGPARLRAKPTGSPGRRTTITSADQSSTPLTWLLVGREISRFPHKKRTHMPGSATTPGQLGTRGYRAQPFCLPMFERRRHPGQSFFRGSIVWPMCSPVNASRLASRPESRA
jgi:hypothetical protein